MNMLLQSKRYTLQIMYLLYITWDYIHVCALRNLLGYIYMLHQIIQYSHRNREFPVSPAYTRLDLAL